MSLMIGLLSLVEVTSARTALVVIVHRDNSVGELPVWQLRQIYSGRRQVWSSGEKIIPIELKRSNPLRMAFTEQVFGQNLKVIARAYLQRVLSGKGQPPLYLSSDEALAYIRSHPGAIGYLDPGTVDTTVKTVQVQW